MKQRTTQISIVVVMLVLAAVFCFILVNNLQNGEREIDISLPSDLSGDTVADSGDSSPILETELVKVAVTPDNVQAVVASLKRPDMYHLTITAKNHFDDQVRIRTVDHWVRNSNSRTRTTSGSVTTHELSWDGTVYLWADGDETYTTYAKGDFSADASAGMLTYEDVALLSPEQIIAAEYSTYQDTACIYIAAEDEELGYVYAYYIALDSGMLLSGTVSKETIPIYSMEVTELTVGVFDETVFTLPTGQTLIGA